MKNALFLILVYLLTLLICGCISFELSKEEYCNKTWRWDLDCALNETLSEKEVSKVSELALKLKGRDCIESSWNVLKWVEENIEYDSQKAEFPTPIIILKGRDVMIQNSERSYQTPLETVKLGKGICGDYAILTSALLINLDCKPYILRFEFNNEETGHLATAILLDQYYILDQNLPPMDLGSYYKKWAVDQLEITKVHIYDRGVLVGEISGDEMLEFDYKFSDSDLKVIENRIKEMLTHRLIEDPRIPAGYFEALIIKITFPNYVEFYTKAFSEKIAENIAEEILESIEKSDKKWRAFYIELKVNSGDLIVGVHLGR
ncbi:MAG: transglutaminase-like domain-containing protein [Archaeoglobales archaeon]|nr:transglutaminase-like domain-containing protein [Archaeoglobales archaeon]